MHAYRDQYATVFKDGQDVVLIAISSDSPEDLQSWAADDDFQFLMGSDPGSQVAIDYGVGARDNGMPQSRAVIVIAPDGRVAWHTRSFREVDPQAYEELGSAIDRVTPARTDEGP
jgi:peroxiredoxin